MSPAQATAGLRPSAGWKLALPKCPRDRVENCAQSGGRLLHFLGHRGFGFQSKAYPSSRAALRSTLRMAGSASER